MFVEIRREVLEVEQGGDAGAVDVQVEECCLEALLCEG